MGLAGSAAAACFPPPALLDDCHGQPSIFSPLPTHAHLYRRALLLLAAASRRLLDWAKAVPGGAAAMDGLALEPHRALLAYVGTGDAAATAALLADPAVGQARAGGLQPARGAGRLCPRRDSPREAHTRCPSQSPQEPRAARRLLELLAETQGLLDPGRSQDGGPPETLRAALTQLQAGLQAARPPPQEPADAAQPENRTRDAAQRTARVEQQQREAARRACVSLLKGLLTPLGGDAKHD